MTSINRYISFLKWLVPDSLLRFKALSFLSLFAGFLGVTFQVQAFGVLLYYARHFASGEILEIGFLGLRLNPRDSIFLLAIASAGVFLSLILAAAAIYYSRWVTLRLSRKYNEFCTWRVMDLLASKVLTGVGIHGFQAGNDRYFIRLSVTDGRTCGRVLRLLLDLIVPGITLIIAFSTLVYLNFWLTALILFCMLGYLYLQFRISQRAAGYTIQIEKFTPEAIRECQETLNRYKLSTDFQNLIHKAHSSAKGPFQKLLAVYEKRIRATAESRFISGLFMASALAIILLALGIGIIRLGSGWERLLVYLVALRFAMTNMQTVFGKITSMNRFYPQVRRYFSFVQSISGKSSTTTNQEKEYRLFVERPLLEGSEQSINVMNGLRIALVAKLELNRYTHGVLLATMLSGFSNNNQDIPSLSLITARQNYIGCSLREILGLPNGSSWKDIEGSETIIDRLRPLFNNDLDVKIDSLMWDRFDENSIFLVSMLSAFGSGCQWIFLDEMDYRTIDLDLRNFFENIFRNKIVVIVFRDHLDRVGLYGEKYAIVLAEGSLAGIGSTDWFSKVRWETQRLLNNPADIKTAVNEDDDDDLDDDV